MEDTLVVLKPDALSRGLVGRILQRFEDADLALIQAETRSLDPGFVRQHYHDLEERRGRLAMELTERYMISGPVMACRLRGAEAVRNCRRLIGPTMPIEAPPGTIRGDFGHVSEEASMTAGVAVMNLVHASGSPNEARYELSLWFPTHIDRSPRD
ncbi:nucleoside-diphosphate kinase [Nostocoides sp. F2B08]|uniref:nucleoside-diphosphate kinase n=1 Tax=Nostocoides sp. F2B08 TaxID=2653936 RepID=UPI001D0560C7|nr:nucleoside-diphosphate kinase [Tetrasphaera sp. F2B08]